MKISSIPPGLLCAVSLAAALAACDDERRRSEAEAPEAIVDEIGVKEIVSLDAGDGIALSAAQGDRTVSYERLARVPVTDLTPGAAYIDPGIENPFSGDPERIAAGRRHFAAFNCSGCHAPLGAGGMGPSLSDDAWIYGDEPEQIYLTVLHGRPAGMPAFSSMLTEDMIWELAAYIETLDSIEDYANTEGFNENRFGYRKTEGEKPHNAKNE